jgi:DNA-binding CsgD family transcriptional regulator
MTKDPASPSPRAAVRAQRRARRNERIARRENFFDLVASGYSCRQIAEAAKVSVATVRREIDRAIAEGRLDALERYVHVQVARLAEALRLADASIERGELRPSGRSSGSSPRSTAITGLAKRARNERRPPRIRPCPRRRPRPSPCPLRPLRSPTPRRRSTASRRSPTKLRAGTIPGSSPIGANISGPCIGRCVFVLEARADVGPAPPTGVAGKPGSARA